MRKLCTTRIFILLIGAGVGYGICYHYEKTDLIEQYLPPVWEFSWDKVLPLTPNTSTSDEPHLNTGIITPNPSGDYIFEGTGTVISSNDSEINTGTTTT